MPPPRPFWKGYLKLSLVSCPIALYTATSPSERVAFRQINKKTGNRLRQQLIDEESGEPIDPEDKGRGYEVEKGVYLRAEDEELDAIAVESSRTIDIDCFVPKSEIDERYVEAHTIWCRRTRSPWRRLRSYGTPCAARAWWVWAAWSFPSASAWSCSSREAAVCLAPP